MSHIEILSAVHGIAPRSDELLRLGTDFEKGRVSQQLFEERLVQEEADWLQLQTEAGIDIKENGKLHWQDHLRPLVKVADGFAGDIDDAPITRWFEDNRFYRKPTITGRLRVNLDKFDESFPEVGEHVSLLAPGTFAELCTDSFLELPADRNVLELYADLLINLQAKGVKRVTFEEYSDAILTIQGKNNALATLELLSSWCSGISLAVINPRNNAATIPWRLNPKLGVQIPPHDIPIIDRQPEDRRPDFRGGEVWHQLVESATTTPDNFALRTVDILQKLGVARLVLTHSVDLECIPLEYAEDKIRQLGGFTAYTRHRLEER